MFKDEYGEAAVEVLDILDNTKKVDVEKIPQSFIKFLVEIASLDYKVNLDHTKTIKEMNLKKKTKELLGYIYIKWWSNDKEKDEYNNKIKKIEQTKEEKKREKYNPNTIFENKNKIQEYTNETKVDTVQNKTVTMVEYKENILKKIWNKILSFFNK